MWNRLISEPTDSQKFYHHAMTHLRNGNARMAIEVCEQSLRSFPGDANILCLAAKANLVLRQFGASQARAEEAIRLFPDFSAAHEVLGDSLLVQGRAKAARKAYEQAMRLDPARSVTHDKIDRAHKLEQQVSLAGAISPTELAPRQRMAFAAEITRAIELDRGGDVQGAEAIYRDVLRKDPDHIEAARLLAGIAAGHKRFRDAEVFLLKVVSNAPDYARAWVDIANVQRELNKFDAAIDSATQALRLAPEKAESHMLFASAIGMVGRHEEAVEVCKDALELSPDKASVFCIMAHHLKTIGRQDDAVGEGTAHDSTRLVDKPHLSLFV
jgi:tetratricopeptide (TPR) repeat protein